MSTLSLRSNLALALFSAIALAVTFNLPWYGPGSAADEQSIDNLFGTVSQIFGESGVTGHEALGISGTILHGLIAVIIVAAALSLVPALEDAGRGLMNLASMGAVGVLLVKLFDQPPIAAEVDLRYGIFAALAAAGLALAASGAVLAKPKLRKPPARMVDLYSAERA
jgi:hypothetical protein